VPLDSPEIRVQPDHPLNWIRSMDLGRAWNLSDFVLLRSLSIVSRMTMNDSQLIQFFQ
jgi:hypothetical protein